MPAHYSFFRKSWLLGIGFVFASTLCGGPARAWESFDGGGVVGDYLAFVDQANATGAHVEIAGVCASACTMKLGVRRACVHPDAQLWFHAARNSDGRINALATLIMMEKYPSRVRSWAASSGALSSSQFTVLSGAQAIALGVRACGRTQPDYASADSSPAQDVRICYRESVRASLRPQERACGPRRRTSAGWPRQEGEAPRDASQIATRSASRGQMARE